MAYTGIDKEIYESGTHFRPLQEYTQQQWTPPEIMGQNTTTGITNTQAATPYIWPYGQDGGGGGGDGGLGGKWGNLDLSKSKMFDKQVWGQAGPPGQMDWVNQQVQGYYNPQLGNYQTLGGRNINHLGLKVKPIFGSILESMGIGKKDKTPGSEFYPGQIQGTFTLGKESGIDKIKEGWEKEKEKFKNIGVFKKWRENKAIKKEERLKQEIAADNLKAAQASAAAQQAAKTGPARSHTGEAIAAGDLRDIGGGFHEYKDSGTASKYEGSFAQGGRIGYRNGEFVDEDINIQGPNFDVNENIEMAEGPSPFEMRIEELMDEGMSWEEAYNIASQEFSRAEGDESFSQEGIASIV